MTNHSLLQPPPRLPYTCPFACPPTSTDAGTASCTQCERFGKDIYRRISPTLPTSRDLHHRSLPSLSFNPRTDPYNPWNILSGLLDPLQRFPRLTPSPSPLQGSFRACPALLIPPCFWRAPHSAPGGPPTSPSSALTALLPCDFAPAPQTHSSVSCKPLHLKAVRSVGTKYWPLGPF